MRQTKHTKLGELLIVDGNFDERLQIEGALPADMWRAFHAETLTHGIELCSARKFDVIFLEADPLDPDSVTSISTIRHGEGRCNGATIIAMSNFLPGAFDILAERAGADLHIKKPVPLDEIAEIIADASANRAKFKDMRLRRLACS
ncbi:MAG: hypothetical protein ABJ360_25105 [Roseobacter sp.]